MATSLTPITGTANVTNDSTTVEVVGMALSALNCADGAQVFLAGLGYFVSGGPTDTTHFELERPYEGTTGTVSCSIGQVTPEMTQRIALARAIAGFDASAQLIAANQAGLSYSYTGSTAAPISGQVALDNADPASATAINFNEADLSQHSVADRLGQIAAGDQLTIRAIDGSARVSYIASGAPVDEGSYQQVAVTYLGSAGVLAAGAQVVVERIAKGVKGDTGANGVFSAIATQAQAIAGADNTAGMTSLRTAEAIDALAFAPAVIPSNDYNQAIAPGIYVGAGASAVNGPPGYIPYGPLLVMESSPAIVTQLSLYANPSGAPNAIAMRCSANGGSAWTPWNTLVHSGNILGTVSQSAGVPTGAIIESGNDGAGNYYVRYADGTQLCWGSSTASVAVTTAFGTLYASAQQTVTFAKPFLAGSSPVMNVSQTTGFSSSIVPSATGATYYLVNAQSSTVSRTMMYQAKGRWF